MALPVGKLTSCKSVILNKSMQCSTQKVACHQ
jgi:hypothetical protein